MKFSDIDKAYDIVVAGGGITGAGVFHAAVEKGYSALLLEANDFAWGTSSRSSKMVHGGLRYLKQGKFRLTRTAVKERERLLKQYPGLVTPLNFIMPIFNDYGPSLSSMKIGLSIYSFMAGQRQHKSYSKVQAMDRIPWIRKKNLASAVGFRDAQVDDARLVLRLIFESCQKGGTALNYTKVAGIERDKKGALAAVNIIDRSKGSTPGASHEIKTKVLINATGAFAETLHPSPEKGFHIRPLRGSHLIFPRAILPLDRVLSFFHPKDLRPVFLFPLEKVILLGTTDVDHDQDMEKEPFMTQKEADYLLEGINYVLPELKISIKDCISSIAGVRPVLSKKNKSASQESREHVVWKDKGLITVTGGKLTTFNLLANDAMTAAKSYLPGSVEKKTFWKPNSGTRPNAQDKGLNRKWNKTSQNLTNSDHKRLLGRYGPLGYQMISQYDKKLFGNIEHTKSIWAEIQYAAQYEDIHNLSDLLLRRVRIGLFLPGGGTSLLDDVETVCKPFLGWDNTRWELEKKAYTKTWETYYSPPDKIKEG